MKKLLVIVLGALAAVGAARLLRRRSQSDPLAELDHEEPAPSVVADEDAGPLGAWACSRFLVRRRGGVVPVVSIVSS